MCDRPRRRDFEPAGSSPRWIVPMLFGIALAACVPTSPRQRGDLHDALITRTGHGVGSEARAGSEIPEGVQLGDGLSEDEAVSIALWNNPDLQATLASLGFAKGDLQQAGALPNPIFSIFFPLGPKQLEMTIFQMIDAIWKRPYRVDAAKRDVERVAEELVANGLDTVRDTRVAYAELHIAKTRQALLEQAAEIWKRMAHLAQVRLDAGAASQLEVTAVATDARAAQLEVARQVHEVARRRAELAALLNLPREADGEVQADRLTTPSVPDGPTDPSGVLKNALAGRPEIRAAEIAMEAAGARAGLAKAEIFDLMLVIDANGSGTKGFEAGPGLQATLPIFYQNQGARTRAASELEQATWRYAAAQTRVRREVEVAYHQMRRAQGALAAWPDEVVGPLEANVTRAERAYAAGGATYLQVLDATRNLITARLQGVELEREARRAWAELRRSTGGNLDAKP